jgi:predicted RNase H-related nuclease YkuK (DUF458 family)
MKQPQKVKIHEGFRKVNYEAVPDLKTYILDQLDSDRAKIVDKVQISVGTDSKFHPRKGGWSVTYASILAFTFGNKGTHLLMRRQVLRGDGKLSLFERLWQEVEITVGMALWIRENVGIDVDVHLDVNPKETEGSNIIYNAARGYAESYGFVVECKPDSPVAMCAADHLVRNKFQ